MQTKRLLLNSEDIEFKIQRLSNEVAEKYFNVNELYIFGIESEGYKLAKRITDQLCQLMKGKVFLNSINIDKQNPINRIQTNTEVLDKIKNKHILLVDDVLNSGKTLFYAMQLFVNIPIASLRVLVMVNRSHQQFPVYPEFVGITLSTTYQNHIEANISNEKESSVYLLSK